MRIANPLHMMPIAGVAFSCVAIVASLPAHAQQAPVYRVDPFWPKPLPNKWSMQQVVDIYVDKDDHIWAINRADDARPDELRSEERRVGKECRMRWSAE